MSTKQQHMTVEKYFFVCVSVVIAYLFWKILEPFILVLIVAGVAAIILSPLDRRLNRFLKRPKISAVILSAATFFLIFIPVLIVLFLMVTQASDLIKTSLANTAWLTDVQKSVQPLVQLLPASIQEDILSTDFGQIGTSIVSWTLENLGALFSSSTKLILNTFIFFLCLYYLLVNRDQLYKEVLLLSPLDDKQDEKLIRRIVNTIRGVVFGVLMVALIQGSVAALGMAIFHVPGSLIWGALAAVAGLVPLLGTALILVPAIGYLFFTGSIVNAIGLLIWSVLFVSTIDNLIGPFLIGGRAHMQSFLVLISVLGGLAAFGSVGAIAGPTILAALLGLLELYKSGILNTGKLK